MLAFSCTLPNGSYDRLINEFPSLSIDDQGHRVEKVAGPPDHGKKFRVTEVREIQTECQVPQKVCSTRSEGAGGRS